MRVDAVADMPAALHDFLHVKLLHGRATARVAVCGVP